MPGMFSDQAVELLAEVRAFMDEFVYPNEERFEHEAHELGHAADPPLLDELKDRARDRGLWNLFLPHLRADEPGTKLSNLDYAPISEELGKVSFAPELLNCNAPDTGNMEVLHLYGSETVRRDWLQPLLHGEIRSAFSMTEPDVASSDATNIGLRIERKGDSYVLNGTKWFSSNAMRARCKVLIVMGKTDPSAPKHLQQSMIVVPRDTPGVTIGRQPHVFGYDHPGGHPEVHYENVEVPVDNLLGEEGGGFAIAQARLGPGRIHHCMRAIGLAERALELMVDRALGRVAFGSPLADKGVVQDMIAESRIGIDMARQFVYHAADQMDTVGNKSAATAIAAIKVAVPRIVLEVIDRAIQVHGAAGVTQYTPLANMWALARTLRIVDGPDDVHKMQIARREVARRRSLAALAQPS